jgi:uncharacterized protein YcnI
MPRILIPLLALVVIGVGVTATPVLAHVDVADSTVQPNGDASVTFSFDHGCDGEPTTSLRVQVPEGVSDVVPQPVDGWQTASSATEFSWSGGSVPDGQQAAFTATMRVSGTAGDTIWFPTVQGCPSGEEAWIETAAPGAPEPENVAPSIVLAVTVEATTTTAPATTAVQPSTTRTTLVPGEAAVTKEGSPRNNTGLVVGLIAVGAIVVGALVLYFRNRGRGNTTRT